MSATSDCPACRRSNPAQATFCGGCGAALAARCFVCGTGTRADQRYCHQCGTALADRPPRLDIRSEETDHPGERKHVTILFADTAGSTALIADQDPERATGLLDPIVSAMRDAVRRYDGTVVRVMGDGIMAVFGAPVAHEDHALRAVYSALALLRSVRTPAASGRPDIRVGLHSGEVLFRSVATDAGAAYDATGATTHLASRLEQMAIPGTVRISDATRLLVEGFVEMRPLGPVAIRGFERPIECFEAIGPGAPTRFQVAAGRGLTPLVGRSEELTALHAALACARGGGGRIVAVSGEAGIGKSRLFWEFLQAEEVASCRVLATTATAHEQTKPWHPLLGLMRARFGIEPGDDRATAAAKVLRGLDEAEAAGRDLLPPLLSLLDVEGDDREWSHLDPPQRRRFIINAARSMLLADAARAPLVLVFEDLHWADGETLDFLGSLIAHLAGAPILLLVNYRPDGAPAWARRAPIAQLRIGPLAETAAQGMLDALLGEDSSLLPVRRLLVSQAEGNPLYLEESIRTLVETGVLAGPRGARRLVRPVEAVAVPPSIRAVIAARIDRLAPAAKRLLQAASVVGNAVPVGVLAAAIALRDDAFAPLLRDVTAAELLVEARLSPDPEYAFRHDLIRAVAYDGLLLKQRKELHARVAAALERLMPERLGELGEVIAEHYERGDVWTEAASHFLAVAARHKERYVYASAIALCRRSLASAERAGGMGEVRARAFELLGDLSSLTNDPGGANECYGAAIDLTSQPAERRRIHNKRHRPHLARRGANRISYFEHGQGEETLLFVSPLAYDPTTFQPVLERLCQDFRIITMDPLGFGASDPMPEHYALIDQAHDVAAVIADSRRGPVTGVGLSRGGIFLVMLAAEDPALLDRMVLVSTPTDDMGPGTPFPFGGPGVAEFRAALAAGDIERALRIFASFIFSEPGTEDLAEHWIQSRLSAPEMLRKFFAPPREEMDIKPLLPVVRTPTLVMSGSEDRRVPAAAGRYIHARIRQSLFYLFAGKGHLPVYTATQEFCDVLSTFARGGTIPEPVESRLASSGVG